MTQEAGWRALARAVFGWSGQLPAWREHAACVGEDPRLFDGGGSSTRARKVCRSCPVIAECLADQMDWERAHPTRYGIPAGVFGGMTASERQAVYLAERRTTAQKDLFDLPEAS